LTCLEKKSSFVLKSFILHVRFRNKVIFYGEELLALCPTHKLEGHPLSAVRDCLFNIFAATLHTWRVRNPEGKRPLERPRRRWVDNIIMDLREIGWDGGDWVDLAQDRDQWRALVRAVMNLRVP
jgi:hypothetical protein